MNVAHLHYAVSQRWHSAKPLILGAPSPSGSAKPKTSTRGLSVRYGMWLEATAFRRLSPSVTVALGELGLTPGVSCRRVKGSVGSRTLMPRHRSEPRWEHISRRA